MKRVFSLCLILAMLFTSINVFASGEDSDVDYDWSNLKIGGEGFVTGMVFHPTEKDLFYIKTDVGGAYRWNPSDESWIPLCDGFSRADASYGGCDGIAIDAQDPDVLYMASGSYSWSKGEVLKSTDRGNTWKETGLKKAFGANQATKGHGECIAVDPLNSNIVYVGTIKDGVWMSDDGAATWKQVSAIDCNKLPARNVAYDPTSFKDGRSQTVYIGVMGQGVFCTRDGGVTWNLLEGTPKNIKSMQVTKSGVFFVASETGLFKYVNNEWIELSPGGYLGHTFNDITIDPNNEDIMMCLGPNSSKDNSYMGIPFWRSEDGGKTWVNKYKTGVFHTSQPWKQSSPYSSSYSANSQTLKMNPFNNEEVWYCDFAAPNRCSNINETPQQAWEMMYNGIEEVVPRKGIAPQEGKYRFIAAIADIDGLPYDNILEYPSRTLRADRAEFYNHPWLMSSADIDFVEQQPNIMLRVGIDWSSNGKMEYSLDASESWTVIDNIRTYVDANGKPTTAIPYGRCAVSSQLNPETGKPIFIVIPCYNVDKNNRQLAEGQNTLPLISNDYGKTWQEVKGLPEGTNITSDYWNTFTPIVADGVEGNRFYMFFKQDVYVSDDWGYNWTKTANIPCDPNTAIISSAPGKAGEVWVSATGGTGLYRSKDYGKTFTKVEGVTNVETFGFGKEAPGRDYPTLYLYAEVNGVDGVFRSIDIGESFVRINDDAHKFGSVGRFMIGDMQTFGIVYIGLNGRGFTTGMPKSTKAELIATSVPSDYKHYKTNLVYNSKPVNFTNEPIIMASWYYVPIREFMESIGVTDMTWDADTYSFTIKRMENDKERVIKLQLSERVATVNGEPLKMIDGPRLLNDRMYVPLNDFVKALGATVEYDGVKKVYTVTDNASVAN